jgi:UPF0716 family protein affecting phage T7 exclusion
LHGYLLVRSKHWQSAILVVAGFMLIDPNFITDLIGAGMLAFVALIQLATRRKMLAAAADTPAQ